MKNKLQELLDYLEYVHLDEKERYTVTVNRGHSNSYDEILNREKFLEFAVEVAINDVMNMIDDLEGDAS